jgi:hypothetical protein
MMLQDILVNILDLIRVCPSVNVSIILLLSLLILFT